MRIFGFLYSELNEWIAQLLRWLPGNFGIAMRYHYYKHHLAGCGERVTILTGCHIRDCKNIVFGDGVGLGFYSQIYAAGKGNERIRIGDDVSLNSNVMINADQEGRIEIGPRCIIGPNVVFRTSNHEFSNREIPIREQGHRPGAIVVKENVWIGANVVIIGDVTVGRGAIIGAGSVVIGDVDDFAIVAGVPARRIGER